MIGKARGSKMRAITVVLTLALVALIAGCNKNGADHPAGTVDVESLPVIQPATGGAMVLIPAGTFTMGESAGRPDETAHSVSVSSFYLDKYPVTQELYEKVMGVNPSKRKNAANPVERTQWTDAVRFCNKCSELDGLTPCYDLNTWECHFTVDGYRLPTEAEWEYACRAGSAATYCFGDDERELPRYAWLKPHSQGKPRPVGQKLPNRWGLFDMHGNVWQWCNDWYDVTYYAASPQQDPRGPATGKMRVLRGGALDSTAEKCRAAYRHKEFPVYSDACFGADSYGFRRARNEGRGARGEGRGEFASAKRKESQQAKILEGSPKVLSPKHVPSRPSTLAPQARSTLPASKVLSSLSAIAVEP